MRHAIILLGVCAGVAACIDRAGLPVSTSSASTGTPGTTTTTGAAGSGSTTTTVIGGACTPLPPSPACVNPDGKVVPSTAAEFVAAISGRWLLCGTHESVFGVDGGDVGLEITPDHHFYKLYLAKGGATVRGAGANEEGSWSNDYPGQLNLEVSGSGTVITAPVFTSMPRSMYLDNNGVFRATYVIDASVPTGTTRCPKAVDLTRSGACTPPAEETTVCADGDPARVPFGRWSRCGGTMPDAPPHDGIALAADGTLSFLHLDPTGALVPGAAATDRGAVDYSGGILCQTDFTFKTTAGGTWISSTVFFPTSPRQMWIYTEPESGDPERYTFVGP